MAASVLAFVDPALLVWARRSANLEPLAAARKIDVTEERLTQWEAGEARPTIAELRRAGAAYNRALAVFYLPEPPQGFETLRDFRRLDTGGSREWSAALHAEYRRAHFQRDALLEIAELDEVEPSQRWRIVGVPQDNDDLAARARAHLLGLAPLPPPRRTATKYDHLNFWSAALEESGLLVMSTEGGDVSPDEMRAFSLYFEVIPIVVLNGADAARGRLFSLIHEYAHLLLQTAGLCDTVTDTRAVSEDRRIEARCNALAAAVLMPADAVLAERFVVQHPVGQPWTLPELIEAARPFGVSVESFLRRLVTLGRVPMEQYQAFREENKAALLIRSTSTGGNFYYTKARDLGKGYVRTVTQAHRRTIIDTTTAATYLDVKVGQMARLAEVARA